MRIASHDLTERVFIVAEVGNNHEGDFQVARELVQSAAECGADAVKFQTFRTELFVRRSDQRRFAQLSSYELDREQFVELFALARELGLVPFSTPLDLVSAEFLYQHVDAIKIASGDNDCWPLIASAVRSGKPLIISTGLSDFEHVRTILDFVRGEGGEGAVERLALLHCVCSYPVPAAQASLRSVAFLAERLSCTVGYSDHTVGIDAAPLAVALGARIIEKHFTLDHDHSEFRDHKLSADPDELGQLVARVRAAEQLLGTASKCVQSCEEPLLEPVRRSIVAARDLEKGTRLEAEDLGWMRPGSGLRPGREGLLIGKTLTTDREVGEAIQLQDVE